MQAKAQKAQAELEKARKREAELKHENDLAWQRGANLRAQRKAEKEQAKAEEKAREKALKEAQLAAEDQELDRMRAARRGKGTFVCKRVDALLGVRGQRISLTVLPSPSLTTTTLLLRKASLLAVRAHQKRWVRHGRSSISSYGLCLPFILFLSLFGSGICGLWSLFICVPQRLLPADRAAHDGSVAVHPLLRTLPCFVVKLPKPPNQLANPVSMLQMKILKLTLDEASEQRTGRLEWTKPWLR